MSRAILALVAVLARGGAGQFIQPAPDHDALEYSDARRYVDVERAEADARWVSRGCGFEADWECRDGSCRLLDSRAHAVDTP